MVVSKFHFIILGFVACCFSALFAADVPDVYGMPKNVVIDGGLGVYLIWYDNGTWHLRTSTEDSNGKRTKTPVVFTGTITCDGKVIAHGVTLDSPKKDYMTPHADGNGFDFHFTTHGATDEASFTVPPTAKTLKFKFMIGGTDVQPTRVLIGKNGSSPEKSEFLLPANPKEKAVAATVKPPMPAPKAPPAPAAKPTAPAGTGPKGKTPDDE